MTSRRDPEDDGEEGWGRGRGRGRGHGWAEEELALYVAGTMSAVISAGALIYCTRIIARCADRTTAVLERSVDFLETIRMGHPEDIQPGWGLFSFGRVGNFFSSIKVGYPPIAAPPPAGYLPIAAPPPLVIPPLGYPPIAAPPASRRH